MSADFYDLLEVDGDADDEELKRAYREAVRRYHPDVNDNENADAQFKVVKRAYETLSNSKERARYDRLGHRSYVRDHLGGLPTTVVSTVGDGDDGSGESKQAAPDADGAASSRKTRSRWDGRKSSNDGGSTTTGTATGTTNGTAATGTSSRTARETNADDGTGGAASDRRTNGHATDATSGSETDGTGARATTAGPTTTGTAGTTAGASTAGASTAGASTTGATANSATATATTGATTSNQSRKTAANGSETNANAHPTDASTDVSSDVVDPHRVGLRRGLYASVAGLVAYLVGLISYLFSHAGAVASLLEELAAAPLGGLVAGIELGDPLAYVLASASQPGAGLAFAVGLLTLPLTVGTTVLRFGRGTARLYALAVLAPAAWLALASELPFSAVGVAVPASLGSGLPAGVTVLLLVVIPVGATLAFVVDVGRYLYAG